MTYAIKEMECTRVKGSSREKLQERITVESNMTLYVNDKIESTFIHSAGLEEQLAVGFMLSSGLVSSLSQIERSEKKGDEFRIWTGEVTQHSEASNGQLEINHDTLLKIRKTLNRNQKNHFATRGFHGAILWEMPTGKWFMCEDIGRHNAVDKVIGYGIMNGYALSQSMVLLSGRLVSNIVSKCMNAGIPLIASMTVATDVGIRLAKESDMTIIGSLSEDGFWLYNEGVIKIS